MVLALALWATISVPVSLLVGAVLTDRREELVGMNGDEVVYVAADGVVRRVHLLSSAPA